MWRTNGAGELYTYLPPDFTQNQVVCDVPPFSTCNDVYGASIGRGSFSWKTGGRTTIAQRLRLNDAGQSNGELELFVGGKSVINVGGLVISNSSEGRIRGMQFQTFFGGTSFRFCNNRMILTHCISLSLIRFGQLVGIPHGPVRVVLRLLYGHHGVAMILCTCGR